MKLSEFWQHYLPFIIRLEARVPPNSGFTLGRDLAISQTANSNEAERYWSLFGFIQNDRRCSMKSETPEKTVSTHANTKLIGKVTEVCYEEPSASVEIELEVEQDREDAEAVTDDTDSTPETE